MSISTAKTYIGLHDQTGHKSGQTLPSQPVKYIDTNSQLLQWREQLYKERKGKKSWYYKHQDRLLNDVNTEKSSFSRDYRNTPFSRVGTIEDLKRSKSMSALPPQIVDGAGLRKK
mmetsp:Transcript_20923/g.52869  ORF Transcript_20923/g.52869 Transcript_20923/m.52869 type:complete len:115 (+) Transcript_20923:111-455(+)